jgi:hypothetical protein
VALTNALATLWSDRALIQLEKELIYGSPLVCNRDYEGLIQDQGKTVNLIGVYDPIVGSYTQDTDMTLAQLTDFQKTLILSEADYYDFAIDDIQTVQSIPKLMPQALVRAAYKLADKADKYVAGVVFAAAGTTATDTNFTSAAVLGSTAAPVAISPATFTDPTSGEAAYEWLVDLGVALDQNAVPRVDRYVIVPPFYAGMLSKDLRFSGYEGYGQGTVLTDGFAAQPGKNGFAGSVAGFNVVVSLNCPTGNFNVPSSANPYLGADGSSQPYYEIVAGVPSAITFANQIVKTEAFRPQARFSDAVKGLHVYGTAAIWPERIVGGYIAQGTATTH